MGRIAYTAKDFTQGTRDVIDAANDIIEEYQEQGFDLTLRQLYYQFVARDLLANSQKSYKRLGSIVNDARLAGEMDWHAIVDRTRSLNSPGTWESPASVLEAIANQYAEDKWENQGVRFEVWIEKEALAGVFEPVCDELGIPFFSCRGYVSQSAMWRAAQRLIRLERCYDLHDGIHILHFGDHDPSGMDMTRDIRDRLELFGADVFVERCALNMNQVEEYDPPPNPAKLTDARATSYVEEFGKESWELDALDPATLADIVRREVKLWRNEPLWDEAVQKEQEQKAKLRELADNWDNA